MKAELVDAKTSSGGWWGQGIATIEFKVEAAFRAPLSDPLPFEEKKRLEAAMLGAFMEEWSQIRREREK